MTKKIDSSVKEKVKLLCYEVVLGEMIDSKTWNNAKEVAQKYLNNNDYKINWVKCDAENNPPSVIDSNQMIITVSEEANPGSSGEIIHEIIL